MPRKAAWEVERLEERILLSTSLLLDANPAPAGLDLFSNESVQVGDVLFFVARDNGHGLELWKTDGTLAGTALVKDINPLGDSNPNALTNVGGRLYFTAYDPTHGYELWRSDGTDPGTVLVRDIEPGYDNSNVHLLAGLNGTLFFTADHMLWMSDGTEAGTIPIRQLVVRQMLVVGDVIYMNAEDPLRLSGFELWKTDGTLAGTKQIKDINTTSPQAESNPGLLAAVGGTLMFVADDGVHGRELWKSDGTEAGTALVRDVNPGPSGSWSDFVTPAAAELNGTIFFAADDGTHGSELWASDLTEAGTYLVKDISEYDSLNAWRLKKLGDAVYFWASDPLWGEAIWRSDGTEAGTAPLSGPWGSASVRWFSANDQRLFFSTADAVHGFELWQNDGTIAGTELVADISPGYQGSLPEPINFLNGRLLFTAETPEIGRELWWSDGTAAGTAFFLELRRGTADISPSGIVASNGRFYFNTTSFESPWSIWTSDGTPSGTSPLDGFSFARQLSDVDGSLFFYGDRNGQAGLWKSDGTSSGTTLLREVYPSEPVVSFKGSVLFAAERESRGTELWKVDATTEGAALVLDLLPGPDSSNPRGITVLNNVAFFSACTLTRCALWRTDGSPLGTYMVSDSVFLDELTVSGNRLYVIGYEGGTGTELWTIEADGSRPSLVKDITSGFGADSYPQNLTDVNGTLFFTAYHPETGRALWKSDGTEAGTVMVKDIHPGLGTLYENHFIGLTNVAGALFFVTQDTEHGFELWRSDGTPDGTTLVKDINPGPASSFEVRFPVPSEPPLVDFDGVLYFAAYDPEHGTELWSSDGTESGTRLVEDINPGGGGSHPNLLVTAYGRLLFTADDGSTGVEVWQHTKDAATDRTAPTVVSIELVTDARRKAIHTINVTFSEHLPDAQSPVHYKLELKKGRRLKQLQLATANYDVASQTVTLVPVKPLGIKSLGKISLAVLDDALSDLAGNAIDGDYDGIAGGDLVQPLSIAVNRAASVAGARLRSSHLDCSLVDVILSSGNLLRVKCV